MTRAPALIACPALDVHAGARVEVEMIVHRNAIGEREAVGRRDIEHQVVSRAQGGGGASAGACPQRQRVSLLALPIGDASCRRWGLSTQLLDAGCFMA